MSGVQTEGTRMAALLRSTQSLIHEAGTGDKPVSPALASQLSELVRDIEYKLESKDNIDDRKLGILFAFLAWHHIEADTPAFPQLSKFFDHKDGRLILKSSKLNEDVLKQVQEYSSKPQEVVSWITLPQPGTPGSMSLSKGKSFVKKVVSISKGAGGGQSGCVLEDRFTQPITQDLLDRMPDPEYCIFFRLGSQPASVTDFKDKYVEDEEDEELQRNNDLDDMF